ncbi:MAG TPA: hypothetical protein VN922_13730 [Bacteroidia bacterium]|nr:hypothetical protein [Bacteroidia bacterium]
MKKLFEKSFNISLVMGTLAVLFCVGSLGKPILIFGALGAGFFGFILCCANIVFTQKFNLAPKPAGMMILSLFLNSVPLFYMMVQIMQHQGGK